MVTVNDKNETLDKKTNSKIVKYTKAELHHNWCKEVKIKGKKVFHPYTRLDFKFGEVTLT